MAKNLTKNQEKKKTAKSSGIKKWLSSERMKHGAIAKVFTVAFLLVLILCNVLVGACRPLPVFHPLRPHIFQPEQPFGRIAGSCKGN